jgi:transcriptional regulator with XRE-family HTH domain
VLRELRTARGISQAAVAARAGIDRSYVNRMEAGERGAPAEPAVEALIGALRLDPAEGDRLTAAAGLLPRALRRLGPDDPTVLLLAERLADPALAAGARDALRATVEAIVRHWSTETVGGQVQAAGAGGAGPRIGAGGTGKIAGHE